MDQLSSSVFDTYGLNNLLDFDLEERLPVGLTGLNGGSNLFSTILVRLLIQTANELQRTAATQSDSSRNDAFNANGFLSESTSPLLAGNATSYSANVATQAYRQGDDWQFVPVHIPPTPESETHSNLELEKVLSSSSHPAPLSATTFEDAGPAAPDRVSSTPSPGGMSLNNYRNRSGGVRQ